MKQQVALIVFSPETTAAQVKAILNELQHDLNNDNHILDEVTGARIECTRTQEFDPDCDGEVIYRP